jgi:5-methyltetrahydropteroyltriglutamate--homocysteine methyltransferase
VDTCTYPAKSGTRGQLALSPQCGFASGSLGNLITVDDERRKLDLVVSVAGQVWG